MKKAIVLAVLFGLAGFLLAAASPLPHANQALHGTLQWQHVNVCGVSDFVPTQSMTNVYLTGKFRPSNGLLQGCQIDALGFYYRASPSCTYFVVDTYKVDCSNSSFITPVR